MDDLTQQGVYLDDPREGFADFIPAGATRVADIGCGKGGFGRTLRSKLGADAWIVGVESVAAQAAAARDGHGFDEVVTGFVPQAMPSSWSDLDLLCFMDVLEHIYDPWAILQACHEVLAEDGRVLASIPNIQHLPVVVDLVRGRWDYQDTGTLDRTHVRFFTRTSIIEMFHRAGFEVERIEGVDDVLADPRYRWWRPASRLLGDLRYVHMVVVARKASAPDPPATLLSPVMLSAPEQTTVTELARSTAMTQRQQNSSSRAALNRWRHLLAVEAKFRLNIPTDLACDFAAWRRRHNASGSTSPPFVESTPSGAALAVALHVYYPELLPGLIRQLGSIDVPFDLFVTNAAGIDVELPPTSARTTEVIPVENRGRDVWPFYQLVQSGRLDGYEAVLKLHTKKSPEHAAGFLGAADGEQWRTFLVDSVLGSRAAFRRAFEAVTTGQGGVACHGDSIAGAEAWATDRRAVRHLARRLAIATPKRELRFPAGSIFIMRGALIADLKKLRMSAEDFEDENSPWHTTTAHALERLIGYVARAKGLIVVGL